MLSRFVRGQLAVFALLGVLAVVFASVQYVNLPQLMGFGRYHVSVVLPQTGGLYGSALVSMRGVPVGKVESVDLTSEGVTARLAIDSGQQIPGGVRAEVHSMSAVGEQYVDLVPQPGSSGVLADGAVIGAGSIPVNTGTLLQSVNSLAASIPAPQLATSVNEFAVAFRNTSGDLRLFLRSAGLLLDDAQANINPTVRLIKDLVPVLTTQQAIGTDLVSSAHDLDSFTRQLRMSDSDIRATIANGQPFAQQLNTLVNQLHPTLPMLMSDLADTGRVLQVYLPNVETTLVLYPAVVAYLQSYFINPAVRQVDAGVTNFRLAFDQVPPCTDGFIQQRRDPGDLTTRPIQDTYCRAPANSPLAARGARNDPCPNNPAMRSATAAGCGLRFRQDGARNVPGPLASTSYDPVTGKFTGPDGLPYFLGGVGKPVGDHSLKGLLLASLPATAAN